MSFNILKRLGFDDQYINKICFYIKNHDNPINERLIIDDYEKTLNLYKIQQADALTHNPNKSENRKEYLKDVLEKLINSSKTKI